MKNILVMAALAFLVVFAYKTGKRYFLKPHIKSGVEAKDITGNLPDGRDFSLSDLRGQYVLLDFWGSWCKPCRKAHPELIDLYREFHTSKFSGDTGFEIVSFGVERSADRWSSAIQEDNLPWPYHFLSTELFEHPVVKAYNVRQIPTRFLIDPNGNIISVDPSIEQIKKHLGELRNK